LPKTNWTQSLLERFGYQKNFSDGKIFLGMSKVNGQWFWDDGTIVFVTCNINQYLLIFHRKVTQMSLKCHSNVTQMSLKCHSNVTQMSFSVSNQTYVLNGSIGSTQNIISSSPVEATLNGMIEDRFPTITNNNPNAWIAITLPETITIPYVKVYTWEVRLIWHTKSLKSSSKIDQSKRSKLL